jgi:serine/threonine protein kinase
VGRSQHIQSCSGNYMSGLSSGQHVGQYEIIDTLGEGGMAVVYRAREMNVDREIALKVIKASLTGLDETLERFKREANTIARLSHPHILKLFQFGEHNDTIYLAIELMRGGSLREAIKAQGQLPTHLITRVLEQIGAALDYAHKRGIIHRDLKPQNILLDEDGNAFLTDFGIAKLLNEAKLTQDGLMLGTPSYIAPEQWVGEPADSRTDLYALGVLLFEMLTGQVPFRGKSPVEMARLHTKEQHPSVVKLRPDIAPAVEDVVNRALAKNRAERYQTAGELVEALKAALSGAPIAAKPRPVPVGATMIESAAPGRTASIQTGQMPAYVPPAGNRRKLIGIITGGVAALLIVGFGLLLLSQQSNQSVAVASSATPTTASTATPQVIAPSVGVTTAPTIAPTIVPTQPQPPTATNTLAAPPSPTTGATATLDPTVAAMLNAVDTATQETPATAVAAAATETVPPTSVPTTIVPTVPTTANVAQATVTLAITLVRTTAVPTATTASPTQAPTVEPSITPTITPTIWATKVDPASQPTVTLAITLAGRTATRAAAATATQDSASSTEAAALSTLVPPSSDVTVVVKTNNASIRRGPGLGHPWMSNVKNGDQFPVVSKTTARDGSVWYEITAPDGKQAWIWAQYVNVQPADAQVADAQITPTLVPPRPTATAGLEFITFVNNGPNAIDVFAGGTYAFTVGPGARRAYGGQFANGSRVQVVGVTFVMRDTKTGQTKAVTARSSPSSASYP